MPALLFLIYLVAEVAALVWAVNAIGILATVGLLIAGSALGIILMRSQGRKVLEGLALAARGERSPGGAVADGALVALGALLMVVPGLVTSVIGLFFLLPPTRFLARPVVMFVAARKLGVLSAAATAGGRLFGGGEVIDGEVVGQTYDNRPQPGVRAITPRDDRETGWSATGS